MTWRRPVYDQKEQDEISAKFKDVLCRMNLLCEMTAKYADEFASFLNIIQIFE